MLSSGSCRSTNTAVQIWHTGFLISYLLAGQIAAWFQERITHYCLKEKEYEERNNLMFYDIRLFAIIQTFQQQYATSCLYVAELCTQNLLRVGDCCWALWNFVVIAHSSGYILKFSLFCFNT